MKRHSPRLARSRERGAAAVEAAICIGLLLVPLLAFILLFGRYFWYYTVAQKAAHDAGLYMAVAPMSEIKGVGAPGMASDIIAREIQDLDLDTRGTMVPTVICGYKLSPTSSYISWFTCNSTFTPTQIRTGVVMTMRDPFFSPITQAIIGMNGLPIGAGVTMRYVGH